MRYFVINIFLIAAFYVTVKYIVPVMRKCEYIMLMEIFGTGEPVGFKRCQSKAEEWKWVEGKYKTYCGFHLGLVGKKERSRIKEKDEKFID